MQLVLITDKYLWKIHAQKPKNNIKGIKKIGSAELHFIYLCSEEVYTILSAA
jgi:hypothetical protein